MFTDLERGKKSSCCILTINVSLFKWINAIKSRSVDVIEM